MPTAQPLNSDAISNMPRIRSPYSGSKSAGAGAYGPWLCAYMGLPGATYLALPADEPRFAVTRLTGDTDLSIPPHEIPPEPAYLVTLNLIPTFLEITPSGQSRHIYGCNAGSIGIDSLRAPLVMRACAPLDCLVFYINSTLLDELATLAGAMSGYVLHCAHDTPDPVLLDIGMALMPLLGMPERTSPEFLDHIARATCLHLLNSYGSAGQGKLS